MPDDIRHALTERAQLIEQRAAALAEAAVADRAVWTREFGQPPADPRRLANWMRQVRVVAAYRDRYQIDTDNSLGLASDSIAQQVDAARAHLALQRARHLAGATPSPGDGLVGTSSRRSGGPSL